MSRADPAQGCRLEAVATTSPPLHESLRGGGVQSITLTLPWLPKKNPFDLIGLIASLSSLRNVDVGRLTILNIA